MGTSEPAGAGATLPHYPWAESGATAKGGYNDTMLLPLSVATTWK